MTLPQRLLAGIRYPLAALIFFSPAETVAQQAATRFTANGVEIGIAGRAQTQFNTSSVDAVTPTEFLLRRVRLGANVRVNDFVTGRVHVDFGNNVVAIADAYLQLNFSPGFQVLGGRAFRPFLLMEQTTSLQTMPIERGLVVRGLTDFDMSAIITGMRYGDRDIGVQVKGAPTNAPLGFNYAAAYTAGPVQNSAGNNFTGQFSARASIAPVPRSRLGVSVSRRNFAQQPVAGSFEVDAGAAFGVDFEYGGPTPTPGLHIVAEAAAGDFDPFKDEDFIGGQLWTGYLIPTTGKITVVEPFVRVSHADIDRASPTAPNGGLLFTPGLNIYMGGLNRVMFNYDIWSGDVGPNASSFKGQFQFTF